MYICADRDNGQRQVRCKVSFLYFLPQGLRICYILKSCKDSEWRRDYNSGDANAEEFSKHHSQA